MADKIDMSLDEIIKRDKISIGRGGRRGGKFSTRSTTVRGRNKSNIRKIGATARQMKAGGGPRRAKQGRKLPEKWTHDKFVNEVKSSTIMISNLHYGVSDQDIRELFSEFGPLKKAAVHYDSSGRSLGKAEVIFFKIIDSIRAMKKYNGVALDGRPMNIQPVVNATSKSNIASRIGITDFKKASTKSRGRGGPARRRGRGGKIGQRGTRIGGQRTKVPTAAELDADLDAYTNKI